jgi:tRNA A-37 threonylcarbamoyl transferase component Bud32
MGDRNDYVGQVLSERYRVERLLGKGGMGAVYEGRHVVVGKRVAIKMLHEEFAANEEVLKRFYREAQAAAAIGHKNIIDIMDVGVTTLNEPYIVMEYLEGEDLESMLQRTGPLSVEATCGILEPALQALGAAHVKGIVHRDLKPANIFLVRNEGAAPTVKLIDFGISKFSGGTAGTKLTQTGSLLGTPAYMSPEQARGLGDVDHRTDIYAMGVILYQMLTGTLPFMADNYNALLVSVLTEVPRAPREIRPEIPLDMEALVLKELSKAPAMRSQSTGEMLTAFAALAAFGERASGMSLLGTQLRTGVAHGDLGGKRGSGSSKASASRVLSQMAKATPGVWSGTEAKSGPSKALVLGLAAAAALVVGAVAVVALMKGGASEEPLVAPALPPAAAQAAPAEDLGVQIQVEGVPSGATIVFDGAPVPMNPFRVKRAKTLSPLRVEAPGFEPFAISISPDKDQAVRAEMKPLAPSALPAVAPAATASAEPEKAGRTHRDKKRDAQQLPATGATEKAADKKLSEGRRGALISEDFD